MGDGIPPASAFKLRGDAKLQYVRELFDRIADRYDFVNVIISMGHSTLWRWRALWFAGDMLPVGARVLDVGCGSGRALRLLRWRYGRQKKLEIEGLDCSPKMLDIARRADPKSTFTLGDATALPYSDASFDFALSVYTLRNLPDLRMALQEMLRVLKPRSKLLLLDAFPPPIPVARALLWLWLKLVLPILGGLFTGERWAYEYLAASIQGTKSAHEVATMLEGLGCDEIEVNHYTFGAAACIVATKPMEVALKPVRKTGRRAKESGSR